MNKISDIFKSKIFFLFYLFFVVFLLYGKSISYNYTAHDDTSLIKEKILFISDIKNIPKLFTTSCFYSNSFQYYRPLLTLSFSIETILFGENFKLQHFNNILLFVLALYLIYVFVVKIYDDSFFLKVLIFLFAVHPVFTSVVVWVPGRNDILLTIFVLLSVISLTDYFKTNLVLYKVSAYLFFIFAILTKESAFAVLCLYITIVLLFNYNHKFTKKEILSDIAIFMVIICAYFYIRSISVLGAGENLNLKQSLYNFFIWLPLYLKQFFFPVSMPVMLYSPHFNGYFFIFLILFVSIILFACYRNFINRKHILLAFMWFVCFLFPVCIFYEPLVLFHRLFLPAVGLLIILYEFLKFAVLKWQKYQKYIYLFLYPLILILFYASYIQEEKFANAYVYWENAYLDAPKYHVANAFKAHIEFENKNYDMSLKLINNIIRQKPGLYEAQFAVLLFNKGNYNEAKSLFLNSIKNNIDTAMSYEYLSKISEIEGDIQKASEYARLAYKSNPYNKEIAEYAGRFI